MAAVILICVKVFLETFFKKNIAALSDIWKQVVLLLEALDLLEERFLSCVVLPLTN